jgi:hypothetical protein
MAHYFDDIFHRHVNVSTPRRQSFTKMRRSSSARSISARSDFEASANGDTEESTSMSNSGLLDEEPEASKERQEADQHMNRYVSTQLEKFRSDGEEAYERGDEFEATP